MFNPILSRFSSTQDSGIFFLSENHQVTHLLSNALFSSIPLWSPDFIRYVFRIDPELTRIIPVSFQNTSLFYSPSLIPQYLIDKEDFILTQMEGLAVL